MISVDNYLNETTRHAHVILPGLSALEQPHYDELIWSWAARSAGNYSPAVFPRSDRPHEWEILTRLGAMVAGQHNADIDVRALDDGFFSALAQAKGLDADAVLAQYAGTPYEHGGPGAPARPHDPHRPVGRLVRRASPTGSRSSRSRSSRTASTRARWCRCSPTC